MDEGGTGENIALVENALSPAHHHVQLDSDEANHKQSQEDLVEYSRRERHDLLSEAHENAMNVIGFGRAQCIVFIVIGFSMMSDMVETFVTAFIISGAEREFCLDDKMKGLLGSIVFGGMVIGAFVYGVLADQVGRRPMLLTGLFTSLTFFVVSALVPHYWMFLCCRGLIGISVGGCLALWGPYIMELIPRHRRGMHMTFALFMWAAGGIYACAMAWIIIPNTGLSIGSDTGYQLQSWRIYLLVCAIPVAMAFVGVFFLPETPRYLIEVGKIDEAKTVYETLYQQNHGADTEIPEMDIPIIPRADIERHRRDCCSNFFYGISDHWGVIRLIFSKKYCLLTMLFAALWFATSFATFGLDIWFPEYMSKLQMQKYVSQQNHTVNSTIANTVFTGLVDNVGFTDSEFVNVTFKDVVLKHVTFVNCDFHKCVFSNVTAPQTRFKGGYISNSTFTDTDLYDYKFQGVSLNNAQWVETRTGCTVDFDIMVNDRQAYLGTLIGQLANLPGLAVSAILVDRIGRKISTIVFFIVAGISTFLIWALSSEVSIVIVNSFLNCFLMMIWNPVEVASTEAYPTYLRNTSFGMFVAIGKAAGILGNVVFASMIDVNLAIPICTTAALLLLGGLVGTRIPETKDNLT